MARFPTNDQVEKAAARWCGQKDRETFPEDMAYFRQNWSGLPGLRKYVEQVVDEMPYEPVFPKINSH
jgi:hypothetical protein